MPAFASPAGSAQPDDPAPAMGAAHCEQLHRAVLDGDEGRVRALLSAVLGVGGRLLLERQRAQLATIESLLAGLRREALHDVLTGVYNRRGFLHAGGRLLDELARCLRGALVLYVDVDDIKRVNDTGGHGAGDRQLRDATAVLARAAGPGAILGRLGGDEFAVIARRGARERDCLLERIRSEVVACNADGRWPPLSLSVGVSQFDPLRPASLLALLEQADDAMYRDKTGKCHRSLRGRTLSL